MPGDRGVRGAAGPEGAGFCSSPQQGHRPPAVRPGGPADVVPVRLPQSGALIEASGAGVPAQHRTDVAAAPAHARAQDHCRVPSLQRAAATPSRGRVRALLRRSRSDPRRVGGRGRDEVPGRGQRQGHPGRGPAGRTAGQAGAAHCAVPAGVGGGRPAARRGGAGRSGAAPGAGAAAATAGRGRRWTATSSAT